LAPSAGLAAGFAWLAAFPAALMLTVSRGVSYITFAAGFSACVSWAGATGGTGETAPTGFAIGLPPFR